MVRKHEGSAVVTFLEAEDAEAAIDNMNDAEFLGSTISVVEAHPADLIVSGKEDESKAVWDRDA